MRGRRVNQLIEIGEKSPRYHLTYRKNFVLPSQFFVDHNGKVSTCVPDNGRIRVIIEGVKPEIDGGRFLCKRVVGEQVVVEADIFADGHDSVAAVLLYRKEDEGDWTEVPMRPVINDRYRAYFTVAEMGRYRYTLQAWVDRFNSWRHGFEKKVEAKHDVSVDLLAGAGIVGKASERATGSDKKALAVYGNALGSKAKDRVEQALSEELGHLMGEYQDRKWAATYERELTVMVERERARFSTWYELLPRSQGESTRHL